MSPKACYSQTHGAEGRNGSGTRATTSGGDNAGHRSRRHKSKRGLALKSKQKRTKKREPLRPQKKRSADRKKRKESEIKIDSQNVHGLTMNGDPHAKVEEIREWMTREKTYALLLQETWLFGDAVHDCGGGFLMLSSGKTREDDLQTASGGTAVMLSPAAASDWRRSGEVVWRFTHGIIAVRLSARRMDKKDQRCHKLFLISSYVPCSAYTMKERRRHLELLEGCIKICGKHETLVIGTDANVQLGRRSDLNPHGVLGPFGIDTDTPVPILGKSIASQTLRMLKKHGLCSATTFFQSPQGYHTYVTHGKRATSHAAAVKKKRVQIDHIYIKKRDLKKCKKAWCIGKAVNESDHRKLKVILADTPFRATAPPQKKAAQTINYSTIVNPRKRGDLLQPSSIPLLTAFCPRNLLGRYIKQSARPLKASQIEGSMETKTGLSTVKSCLFL